jgi:phosphatidate cytidylyltransferase
VAAPPAARRSDGTLRVLTALVGLPLVVGAVWLGGWVFAGLVALVCVLAQREFYALARAAGTNPKGIWGLAAGACVALHALWPEGPLVALLLLVVYFCTVPFRNERSHPLLDVAATFAGVVYPTAMLSMLVALRVFLERVLPGDEAFWATLTVFLLIFAADTVAYYTGRAFGRRPFAPRVSPKKTWEGAMGGVVGAGAAAAALKLTVLPSVPWGAVAALAAVAAFVSPLGDLAESRLKRSVGVKDSGNLLPGHGGLLDRFDALTVAAPLAYVVLRLALA